MAKEAATKALADARIHYSEVKQAVVGFVYGLFYFPLAVIRQMSLNLFEF